MDIDFIKWMVGYVKEFEFRNNNLIIPKMAVFSIEENSEYFDSIIYPLLLQRAIEGINKGEGYLIFQDFSEIHIEHNTNHIIDEYYSFEDYKTIDQAKESALKYIYQQETNK